MLREEIIAVLVIRYGWNINLLYMYTILQGSGFTGTRSIHIVCLPHSMPSTIHIVCHSMNKRTNLYTGRKRKRRKTMKRKSRRRRRRKRK